MNRLFPIALITLASSILVACGGSSGSGAPTVANQDTSNEEPVEFVYTGPDPVSSDVQNFRVNVWDNLVSGERCGACHTTQEPAFLQTDDINAAYAVANEYVDLDVPSDSRLVTKVAEDHNCWESVSSVCADIITGFIENWAAASGTVANTITFTPPTLRDVADSKNFPQEVTDFENTVYPLLETFCADCHSEDAPTMQQPFLGSADALVSYEAAKSRIDLTTPANSRLVVRLLDDLHNCWTDCIADGAAMEAAITDFSDLIPVTSVDEDLVISRALGLFDGISANAGGRVETNAIALWDFSTGSGEVAFDKTGIDPSVNLTFNGDVQWVGGFGIDINPGGRAQALTSDSTKLFDMITATGEYSIEAWVVPGNVTQEGPARIVSYSGAQDSRNFMLGQTLYNYDFHARSSTSDANGGPALSTPNADEILQATLQHVVATFDPINGRRLYVNGELISEEAAAGGNLNAWDSSFALVLGAEVDGEFGWDGIVRFLAIYNRAMAPEDIVTNFEVGVGEKYFLLFNVDEHVDIPDSYIAFEVSQFDSYSYLFSEPFFISLNGNATITDTDLEGMYIGINGREVPVGQAFANLDVTISDSEYVAGAGQPLSRLGSLVPLEFGSDEDVFFLSFNQLGQDTYNRPAPAAPTPPEPIDLEPQSDIGLKHFAEVNATLAQLTGVAETTSNVQETYNTLRAQLPTNENIAGFLSSHQMGITQLAVEYCNTMVNQAGGSLAGRDQLIDDLLAGLLAGPVAANGGAPLTSQPDPANVTPELVALYDRVQASSGSASTAAVATCAAIAGSAIMLIQ